MVVHGDDRLDADAGADRNPRLALYHSAEGALEDRPAQAKDDHLFVPWFALAARKCLGHVHLLDSTGQEFAQHIWGSLVQDEPAPCQDVVEMPELRHARPMPRLPHVRGRWR